MNQSNSIDLDTVARELDLPAEKVLRTVALLDEGNTVPFITRYRKDQTGGFDEEQIRLVQDRVIKLRMLAERKTTILKSIESQGKLTPELEQQIRSAPSTKRLEDLYLPFKPKKQTLATIARQRGLEPLAKEILEADPAAKDLLARAADFVSPDKDINSAAEVLLGVGHLLAERFSEHAELRGRLRRIFQKSGKLFATKVETPPEAKEEGETERRSDGEKAGPRDGETEGQSAGGAERAGEAVAVVETVAQPETDSTLQQPELASPPAETSKQESEISDLKSEIPPADANQEFEISNLKSEIPPAPSPEPPATAPDLSITPSLLPSVTPSLPPPDPTADPNLPTGRLFEKPAEPAAGPVVMPDVAKKAKKKKKKKKVIGEHAFKDYYNFQEALGKLPPHRVLAINRGERARAIRVKLEADFDAMLREAEQILVPPDHPHADFLRGCTRDAFTRLIVPSLEREVRRELTDWAEEHAVDVFIRNLRKLLLQQPVRGRRVLAIDPGFKSGCKMVALDEFGNVLGHSVVYVIGKDDRREKARQRVADAIKQYNVSVIVIGNGTGCRETEQLVADVLAGDLEGRDVAYVIVNEAGASIYSTSQLGREELPQYDALQRGAISIGRRLLDPLSEMVKINPANLGVGLYQHDVKAKHLKDSLDAVVESCVNFVGVDVNAASPALLRYVSGMNALTARRVYEFRREHGPFKNREELKKVPGFGEQTFVQAAGFLKVIGGENPLDATWIHPESYAIAQRVLESLGTDVTELAKVVPAPVKAPDPVPFGAGTLEEGGREQGTGDGEEPIAPSAEATAATPAPVAETVVESTTESSLPQPDQTAEPASPPPEITDQESEISNLKSEIPPVPDSPSPVPSPPPPPARNVIAERAATVDVKKLAEELAVGTHTLRDILGSLTRPGLDPRDDLNAPVLRRGIMKLEDLQAGMELSGTVLNVVDFGAFVDIGLSDSGLVHISRLADRFIRDPHEVVGVGDVLKVWVVDVDKTRRRVSLTAIAPGTERPPQPRREQRSPRRPRPEQAQGAQPAQGATPATQQQGDRPPQGQRPPRPQGQGYGGRGGGGGGGGGRRDQGRGGGRPQQHERSKTVDRPPTKPKVVKPLTKAMEEGKEPLRSFSDLLQLFDKKKKPKDGNAGGEAKPS